jgi:dienelactone hydrolase
MTRDEPIEIVVDSRRIGGTLVSPATRIPGFLFVHGWSGNQKQYLARAQQIAALGCVCLTFNLHGHAENEHEQGTVTREDNLKDVIAAYDLLAGREEVDPAAVGVIGSSYGGYLAAILTSLRPVRWLGLRVPALYKDEDWSVPKQKLDKRELASYRRGSVSAKENRALGACAQFEGDVLIVESENDDTVPHPVISNYRDAFDRAHSVTYRVIEGADHALSEQPWQEAYTSLLVNWATEMIVGAREGSAAAPVQTHLRPSPQRGRPSPA